MTVWLKDYVTDLSIAPEGRLRMDCPACGKKNTFSVSDTGVNAYGSAFMQTVGFVGEQDLGYAKTLAFTPVTH